MTEPAAVTTLTIPDPAVVLMMGAPGAGKSTLALDLATRTPYATVLSYDWIRKELTGDESDQTVNRQVGDLIRQRLTDRCGQRATTIVDGTHTLARARRAVLDIAHSHGLPVLAVVLATPLAACHARQNLRARRVPADVIDQSHADLHAALPGLHNEGFDEIHIYTPREEAH